MFNWMSMFGGRNSSGSKTKTSRAKRKTGRALRFESLERRELFALLAGDTLINTTTTKNQYEVASATNASGQSVVAWTHQYSSTDNDVFAQRFDTAGNKLGNEIRVAASVRNEDLPNVSIDKSGNFVVTWTEQVSNDNSDIRAQRFSSTGARLGAVINVAATSYNEIGSSIASDANGNFVIAWNQEYSTTDHDIIARRYLSDGSVARTIVVSNASANEYYCDVAMAPDGRFAISYTLDNTGSTVMVKRYNALGVLGNTHTVSKGDNARISMDDNANTFVVYQTISSEKVDVFARRISSTGSMGSTITIANSAIYEGLPEIAAKRDGTAFVVTYQTFNASSHDLVMAEFTSSGTLKKRESLGAVNSFDPMPVNFGSGGNYQIVRARYTNSTSLTDIYRRKGVLS